MQLSRLTGQAKAVMVTSTALILGACASPSPAAPEQDQQQANLSLSPAPSATNISPDTRLSVTFPTAPTIGTSGTITITDTKSGEVVDRLDLSIPAGPHMSLTVTRAERKAREESGEPEPTYQSNTIGGQEGFRFQPIIVNDNTATIYPHNNVLEYGRTYTVTIDPTILQFADTSGHSDPISWNFTTKPNGPDADTTRVVVDADGSGDFNTVQGALDFYPDKSETRRSIFIKNGTYEEIVFARGKQNLTIRGEDRDKVIVHYANNSSFNPSRNGTSLRPVFTINNGTGVQLSNFTINNDAVGQAEAFKVGGQRNIIDNMTLNGSGDALTTGGSLYMVDSKLTGDGDTILAYATLYCLRCEIHSIGPFTWTRTPEGQHGNVFVDSKLIAVDEPLPWTVKPDGTGGQKVDGVLARLPRNGPKGSPYANFPFAEMVLIDTKTKNIPAIGWGPVEDQETFDWSNIFFAEFNTMDMEGTPVDLSNRHPIVKVLTRQNDAETIASYRNPAFVLDGWTPVVDIAN